MQIIKENTQLK